MHRRKLAGQGVECFGVANTSHYVFALGIDEIVAIRLVFTGGSIACEAHPRARLIVAIAKHHGLHIDGSAQVVANFFAHSVGDGSRAVPRTKHRFDRPTQLFSGLLRKLFASCALDHVFVLLTQLAQLVGADRCVGGCQRCGLGLLKQVLKQLPIDTQDDAAIHRNETSIAVVGKALVIGGFSQPHHAHIVEPQVEHRVQHARHRKFGP